MKVDAYASRGHYADHIMPIWRALPAAMRGIFYGPRDAAWTEETVPRRWPDRTRPMIVAAYADSVQVRPRPLIYVEHGAGQAYDGDPVSLGNSAYSGGTDLRYVVLFLCPNWTVAARWGSRYPSVPAAVVGSPILDRWHAGVPRERAALTIAVTFHWECGLVPETRSAWAHYDDALDVLAAVAPPRGWRIVGHGHPRLWGRIVRRWRQLDVEHTPNAAVIRDEADVLVADNTSLMWEMASLDRPLVVLDAPWYRRDVNHGLRFWTHADAGIRIGSPRDLIDAVAAAIDDPVDVRRRRHAASSEVYAYADGRAARRAAEAIRELMEGRAESIRGEPAPQRRRDAERP